MTEPNDYAATENASGPRAGLHGPGIAVNGPKSVWLEAFSDPVAGVSAYTPCVHVCNLFGDGENRLVIADEDRKLKVGTPDMPTCATEPCQPVSLGPASSTREMGIVGMAPWHGLNLQQCRTNPQYWPCTTGLAQILQLLQPGCNSFHTNRFTRHAAAAVPRSGAA